MATEHADYFDEMLRRKAEPVSYYQSYFFGDEDLLSRFQKGDKEPLDGELFEDMVLRLNLNQEA